MTLKDNPISGVSSNLVSANPPHYYYGLWTKHITQYLDAAGGTMPQTVVEIGPGASLGAGLSALLTGARRYFAFDLIKHTNIAENQQVLDVLSESLRAGTGVRNAKGFPNYSHLLNEDQFAERFFTPDLLQHSLAPDSVDSISRALHGERSDHTLTYVAPWEDANVYRRLCGEIDFVFSHSVMEHVDDIDRAYRIMGELCRPGGGISHQIDFRSHGLIKPWDAYRTVEDSAWSEICEGNPYTINREPLSRHLAQIEKNGFRIIRLVPRGTARCLPREKLLPKFRDLSDTDRVCDGVMVQAVRMATKARRSRFRFPGRRK
jgi:SAM-dependent methyltransferase